jgi:FixJ family two-component response regulator
MNRGLPWAVLIVDDDASFRDSTRRLLWVMSESPPIRVLEASGGEEALKIVATETVDCVLLDYRMPGGTGVEWIGKFLRAREHLAIVMVTGQGDEQTAVAAMKSGAMDYLVKGAVTAATLQRAIANAVEKADLRRTIAQQRETLLAAERQRAMIASLGSVCHHLGQPMMVISTYFQVMKKQEIDPNLRTVIQQCGEYVDEVNAFLTQLQAISFYRNEPYLPSQSSDDAILVVKPDPARTQ